MDVATRHSTNLLERRVKKNFNEFTPVNSKATGNEIINEFLFQKDVAAWFRGTSHYHIKGANKLFNALRDDVEQETTHRVRTCLSLIGLKPMITSKEITLLMHLSRGNDLVFLWFLMENHYKTPKLNPCSFSQNEQLICSAICHLDMVTTLRELDKILPSGHISCVEMKKKCLELQDLKESCPKRRNKMSAHQFVLPYFKKNNRPQHYGKRLFLEQPNFTVNFKYYSHFNNPNYIVQNEANQWYTNYHFNPGKRVVHSIIREIIKGIFYSFETASLKARSSEVLCDYHKTLKVMEADLRHEHIVKTRNKCLKQCLTDKEMAETKQQNKTKTCLTDAVQQQMCIFSNRTKTSPNMFTRKTITSDCKVCTIILGGNEFSNDNCNATNNWERFIKKKVYPSNEQYSSYDFQSNELRKDKRKGFHDELQIAGSSVPKYNTSLEPHNEQLNENHRCVVNGTLQASSGTFFKCPFMHELYKFDYRKIFANFMHCEESRIRKTIIGALNEKTSNLSIENIDSEILYDNAVNKFVKDTFVKEVKRYEAAHTDETTLQYTESSNPLNHYPSSANYNAENLDLMDQMLFDGFQHLRKNPKFVWAQLPDAHKVPFLREWIAHRFGKEYTATERVKSYRRSCLVFRALEKSNMKFSVPSAKRIQNNLFVPYHCRKHVARKVQEIKSKYYHSLDSHFLEHTRAFWFAMRGYICSNGPPRKSFYAYMPSRLQDIQHFSLWKSSDYRNNCSARNTRRKTTV